MVLAIAATLAYLIDVGGVTTTGWIVLAAGFAIGGLVGLRSADKVKMTDIPQLVSIFNAVGGGAAALVALTDFVHDKNLHLATIGPTPAVATALDILIGAVTFTGSIIAAGKLQGLISGSPIIIPGSKIINTILTVVGLGSAAFLFTGTTNTDVLILLLVAALLFGITLVLPIGGADMPVVISLLNAFTGTAVAMAGFVINSSALIIAGALVGASGTILTKLMADAMNRSIPNIMIGGFGQGETAAAVSGGVTGNIRQLSADDAAIQLSYAQKVVFVPGYGLAAAQAQRELKDLAQLLEDRGVEVLFAIHPVAGRMPGHMNVLLAEVDVPYTQLYEMEAANLEFPTADVALVIGANDVINPAARRPGNAISGMPILDVDKAKNVIVIKRSMGQGYAGIDNELYLDEKTSMFFADGKKGLASIAAAVRELVAN
jgi:NAD(P) transhydrogenase subunit beta